MVSLPFRHFLCPQPLQGWSRIRNVRLCDLYLRLRCRHLRLRDRHPMFFLVLATSLLVLRLVLSVVFHISFQTWTRIQDNHMQS